MGYTETRIFLGKYKSWLHVSSDNVPVNQSAFIWQIKVKKKTRILNYLLQMWFGHSQQRVAEQDGNLAFVALFVLLLGVFEQLINWTTNNKLKSSGKTSLNTLHSVFRRKVFLKFQRQTKISTNSLVYLAKVRIRIFYIRSKTQNHSLIQISSNTLISSNFNII